MEPNQVDVVAAAVLCDLQQILHTFEPRLTGQIVGDVLHSYLRNRIDEDVSLVHRVTTTDLYMRPLPDANAALDSSVANCVSKSFSEHHRRSGFGV
jgi:hypothetical protein